MAVINWKNTSENLILILVGVIVGVGIGWKVSVTTAEAMLENQKEIIVEAIKKETTSITNEFKTEIKKLKNRKGEVQFDVKPIIENQIKQQQIKQDQIEFKNDSLDAVIKASGYKKKSWFGRLLSKDDYKKVKTKN